MNEFDEFGEFDDLDIEACDRILGPPQELSNYELDWLEGDEDEDEEE